MLLVKGVMFKMVRTIIQDLPLLYQYGKRGHLKSSMQYLRSRGLLVQVFACHVELSPNPTTSLVDPVSKCLCFHFP